MAFDAGGHDVWVDGMDKGGVDDGLMAFSTSHHVGAGFYRDTTDKRRSGSPLRQKSGVERSTGTYASDRFLPSVKASNALVSPADQCRCHIRYSTYGAGSSVSSVVQIAISDYRTLLFKVL